MFRTVLLSIIRSLNTVFTVIDICRTEILKMGKIVCVCIYSVFHDLRTLLQEVIS